jgi:hypothetical protein
MTRNHFSKRGGPYFINDGFPKNVIDNVSTTTNSVSIIDKIKAFFKSRAKKQN